MSDFNQMYGNNADWQYGVTQTPFDQQPVMEEESLPIPPGGEFALQQNVEQFAGEELPVFADLQNAQQPEQLPVMEGTMPVAEEVPAVAMEDAIFAEKEITFEAEENVMPVQEELTSEAEAEEDEPEATVQENDEEVKRAEHEAAEAKRKAEFEARQQEKQQSLQHQIERVKNMSEEELMKESMTRITADTEKLTRRNMKECVAEYIQTLCFGDIEFARMVLNPRKSMIHCFQHINKKAYQYIQDELKANNIKLGTGEQGYGSDIPDELCYQWAEEYFRNPMAKEDEEEEETFVPKQYISKSGSKAAGKKTAKKAVKKEKAEVKTPEKKMDKKPDSSELEGQLSIMDLVCQQGMAG